MPGYQLFAKHVHRWLSYTEDAASDTPLGTDVVQRLQRFGTYGRLKQIALRKLAHSVAGDSSLVADLQTAFQALDTHKTGRSCSCGFSAQLIEDLDG